jgi:cyclophilin family peptidyl-prolyl cis-trans isomerase
MKSAVHLPGAALIIALSLALSFSSCAKQPPAEKPTATSPVKEAPPQSVTEKPPAEAAQQPPAANRTYSPPTDAEVAAAKAAGTRHAIIQTDKGDINVELYGAQEPLTVANFVKLAQAGFYKGLTFHRVESGFVIQGGDPNADGSGGPGYTIKREVSPKLKHVQGALAMARTMNPDSAGSQFYITLAPTPQLDGPPFGPYAVFGKVTSGMDAAKKIVVGDKIKDIVIQ